MRERASERVQVLEVSDNPELVAERRVARRRYWRDLVVAIAVAVAIFAFGFYCVLLSTQLLGTGER